MTKKKHKRRVFFISDRTGKTAESIGQSLLSQFDGFEYEEVTFSFVNTDSEAQMVASEIQQNAIRTGVEPLVFSTLVDEGLQEHIAATNACVISLFNTFIEPLEKSLGAESSHSIGKPHEEFDDEDYKKRIDAIDFTLNNDDGLRVNQFKNADVILIGVSRCAKTPTCLYLALNFSIKAANYPLTDDDLSSSHLPDFLVSHKEKAVGLTIRADQLSAIREQRRPQSVYASLKQCQREIKSAEEMLNNADIHCLDSTAMSIEEIAVRIVKEKKLLKASCRVKDDSKN